MTKLAVAISNHSAMLGGGEHSFLDLLSRLPQPWSALAVVPGEGELSTRLRKKGIETEVVPLPSIRPWNLPSIFLSLKRYFNLYRRHCPILIYANGSRAAFYGGIVSRLLGLPMVWHCRIADPDIYLDFILRRLSSTIIANSRATARRFRRRFQSKVRVVHNGVDIGWFRNDSISKPEFIDDSWKVVLVVARISRWKRHDLALTAFEKVATREPNAHLVCVGSSDPLEPDWWRYLQDKYKQSKVSNRIHWVDQVTDIRPWYKVAHFLLLPSSNEPFGRVLVEAMVCGVPVVATRTGGIPEIVRNGQDGLLVAPGRVEEIAQAMLKLLTDEALRREMARSALEQAKIFSLDIHVAKMKEVFEDTVKK